MQSIRTELDAALTDQRGTLIYVGAVSLFINLIMLVPALYMLQVYDRVLTSQSGETLLFLTLVLAWMFITLGVLEFVRSRLLVRMGNRLDLTLSGRLFRAMQDFALRHPGGEAPQAINDLGSIRQFLSGSGPFAFFDTPWIPVYLGVLFLFDPWFGWFASAAALLLFVLAMVNDLATRGLQTQAAEFQTSANTQARAQLANTEVTHALGMLPALHDRWLTHHQGSLAAQAEASDRTGQWFNLSKTLRLAFQSLMLGLGAWLAIEGRITAGMVIAGSIIMGRALSPIDQMINAWRGFNSARMAYGRIRELLTALPDAPAHLSLPPPKGHLSMQGGVVLAPASSQAVLKGIEFGIDAGQVLAVIGDSGAGKSSLLRALIGIWPMGAGTVRLDGTELTHWNRDELGPHLGYLPQDVELFDGTVAENIARFAEVDADKVVKAARLAGVDELIRGLPDGYDTRIGQGGAVLSGGQRQRVGLARAVYGDPRLIVLDEPNASLDDRGQWALLLACRNLKQQGVTQVIVSHRPDIVRLADRILVLESGKQRLFGDRDAVLSQLAREQGSVKKGASA